VELVQKRRSIEAFDFECTLRFTLHSMSTRANEVWTISIKEAAVQTKLTAHTLRYYERIGLLPSIARDLNGQRRYTAHDLGAISILLTLRATGMPIGVMQRFVQLLEAGDSAVPERRALLEAHQRAVRANIAELETNLGAIEAKIDTYKDLEATGFKTSCSFPSPRAVNARAQPLEV
jgi:DNA-binding transcriptional MerR regulator